MPKDAVIVKHHIPILDEHELKDNKGGVVIRLDQEKLQAIVNANNSRINNTGDEIPLVIGHTKDNASETEQPEIVGYASNLSVEPFFKTGRKCITATFKFFKHAVDKVKGFPRRSIELWLSDYKIDPISLLGATTPERDLGLLRLEKNGVKKYKREIQMDSQEIVNGVLEGLQQTDVWQFLSHLSKQAGQGEEEGAPPDMGGEAPPDMGAEGMPPEEGAEGMPPEGGMEDQMPPDAGEGAPLASEPVEEEQPIQARRKGESVKLSRAQRENHDLKSEVQHLKLKFQKAEREKDLIELEAEGYMLDRDEELGIVTGMPEKTYRSHLAIIRKRYQRAPLGADSYYSESRTGNQRGRTRDEVSRVIDYATSHGISYQDALGKTSGAEKVL